MHSWSLLAACGPVAAENLAPEVALEEIDDLRAGEPLSVAAKVVDDRSVVADLTCSFSIAPGGELAGDVTTAEESVSLHLADGLEAGDYVVRLDVTDPDGAATADTVSFRVKNSKAPTVAFEYPDTSGAYADTLPVLVSIAVEDRDDDVTAVSLAWGGSAAGADGPSHPDAAGGAIFSVELSRGAHTISVVATDPVGASDEAEVSFDVVDGDEDGDDFTDADLGGNDCDDDDARVNPEAEERCNGQDDDCDEEVDEGC